jgi:putative ABC transport system permease protein
MNVHHRRGEIAILRAIGWTDPRVFRLFLGKAVFTGMVGGVLGYAGGVTVAAMRFERSGMHACDLQLIAASLAGAVFLAALASWVPATLAARIDPAVVLQQE